ncbi:AraC family transcriptional regulator [marine bacterium AO1-C]|nr:AraC family transcriptional regulator [marine bacterium AO1-C]
MPDTIVINSITQAHQLLGLEKPKHPLVNVTRKRDLKQVADFDETKIVTTYYQVMFKQVGCGKLTYGRNSYDYEEGTLMFTCPGQVVIFDYDTTFEESSEDVGGWILAFHPDLIRKSELANKMSQYSFFHYDVNEALHLSDEEKNTLEELLDKIVKEYSQNLDKHSQHLIISNIQLLLDYCSRFYDRQFYTRTNLNSDIVSRFERLLKTYYQTESALEMGVPTVNYAAKELHLSSNYLSDLLKKETGKTAQEHIHLFIIEKAKNSLLGTTHSISEIGYALGFEYPQHFSNLFKSKTGFSPREYRKVN